MFQSLSALPSGYGMKLLNTKANMYTKIYTSFLRSHNYTFAIAVLLISLYVRESKSKGNF
jgi:hypothetical protein